MAHLRNVIAHGGGSAAAGKLATEILTALDALTGDDAGLEPLRTALHSMRVQDEAQAAETLSNAAEAIHLLHWDELDDATSQELRAALRLAVIRLASVKAAHEQVTDRPSQPSTPGEQSQPEAPLLPFLGEEITVLTVAEAAAVMRMSRIAVHRLVRRGHLPVIRVRRSLRIPESAVQEYLRRTPAPTRPDSHRA
ncbi:helix-turn-helix domain-containing protein [Streptomyces maremycinicus]|uniref:helix-turn-helix domain-containing protein n=1 Tax=Streptomyces maremycinicus TaxID=1679753 RepID=UPI000ABE58F1